MTLEQLKREAAAVKANSALQKSPVALANMTEL